MTDTNSERTGDSAAFAPTNHSGKTSELRNRATPIVHQDNSVEASSGDTNVKTTTTTLHQRKVTADVAQIETSSLNNKKVTTTTLTTESITTTSTQRIESPMSMRVSHFPHEPMSRPSIFTLPEHQGFLNLAAVLMIGWCVIQMHHTHSMIGQLLDFELLRQLMRDFPMLMLLWVGVLSFECTTAVLFEYAYTRFSVLRSGGVLDKLTILCYVANVATMFSLPAYVALNRDMSPLLRGALAIQICVAVFKYHSYFMTNRYLRQVNESRKKTIVKRSLISLIGDYVDFITMPTLVYEKNFPRKDKIEWRYVIKESTGALICFLCLYLIMQNHFVVYLDRLNEMPFYGHLYMLGVPSLFMWLVGFYGVFHCVLNVIAEVSRFQDREFYLAWWDSTSMSQFWRLWNRAVYKFMCRHIYVESMRTVPFFNRVWAAVSTFVVTAIFHEYVLAVAFGLIRPYFFTMICVQIPYVFLTDKFLKGTRTGNIAMWVGFVVGFPLLQLSYSYSYLAKSSKQ